MGYIIFTNQKNHKSLVFYPIPKNANTSVKMLLAKIIGIDKNFEYRDDTAWYKRLPADYYKKKSISAFLPDYTKFAKVKANIRICIIREPILRFISTYENRILFHKDKKFRDLSVDQVLLELIKGNFLNKHFLPQNYFLGNDLSYFTNIFKINELEKLATLFKGFFLVKNIKTPHLQTNKNESISLSKSQKIAIREIYSDDYVLLNKYF